MEIGEEARSKYVGYLKLLFQECLERRRFESLIDIAKTIGKEFPDYKMGYFYTRENHFEFAWRIFSYIWNISSKREVNREFIEHALGKAKTADRPAILMFLLMFSCNDGKEKECFELVQNYIDTPPFCQDFYLVGYYGLIAFGIFLKESDFPRYFDASNQTKELFKIGRKYLEIATFNGKLHAFSTLYLYLNLYFLEEKKLAQKVNLIKKMLDLFPSAYTIHWISFHFLNQFYNSIPNVDHFEENPNELSSEIDKIVRTNASCMCFLNGNALDISDRKSVV